MERKLLLIGFLVAFTLGGCDTATTTAGDGQDELSEASAVSQENGDDDGEREDGENGDDEENEYGDDDGYTAGSVSYHNQGARCLDCHAYPASAAEGNWFYSGATVYTQLHSDATTGLADGYRIRARLDNGQNLDFSSGRGTANSNSRDDRLLSYSFTAEVIDAWGNVVNRSAADSHNSSRLNCNSCHTAAGANGAPGRIVSYSLATPTETTSSSSSSSSSSASDTTTANTSTAVSFQNDVLPALQNKCSGCHGSNGNFSVTSSAVSPYASTVSFVDTAAPSDSVLLQKAVGNLGHGGGAVLLTSSTEYTTIREWISQGAPEN